MIGLLAIRKQNMKLLYISLLLLAWNSIQCQRVSENRKQISTFDESEVGSRLILTPYVENQEYEKARNLSLVVGVGDVPSFSGFFTVNKEYNSNLFFWFFPAETDYKNAPIIVWLAGGPGLSGIVALFLQFGPYLVKPDLTLEENPHSWCKQHSVIFLDNPVGAGFSFTEDERGYATNQREISEALYSVLTQFFQIFSELNESPIYLTGHSFGGKHVPHLGHYIHTKNLEHGTSLNLAGLIVGNGYTDPINMLDYSSFVYQLGLVDTRIYLKMKTIEKRCRELIEQKKYREAIYEWNNDLTLFMQEAKYADYMNILKEDGTVPDYTYVSYISQPQIRKAIHVGNQTYIPSSQEVLKYLMDDFMASVREELEELLDHYRVLYFNGNMDIVVAYALSVNMYNKMNFSAAEEYRNATRVPWYVDGELAGYSKSAGNFTEVLVRNAGHSVITDKPHWVKDLVYRFTHYDKI